MDRWERLIHQGKVTVKKASKVAKTPVQAEPQPGPERREKRLPAFHWSPPPGPEVDGLHARSPVPEVEMEEHAEGPVRATWSFAKGALDV